jgi:hypothetical protein
LTKEEEAKKQLEIELRAKEAESKLREAEEVNERTRKTMEKLA